jgi:tetratricopeptide (TPR) repeat protein
MGIGSTAEQWFQRALAFRKIEYRRDAISSLQSALAIDPDHIQALKLLSRLFLESHRLEEASDTVKRLTAVCPSDSKVAALKREVSAKYNTWMQRCASVTNEFSVNTPIDTLEEEGWFYYRVKDYPRAMAKLERASLERPTAETFARLGYAKFKLEDVEGAVRAWELGLVLDPTRADLYKELAMVTLSQGQKEPAELFFQEAVRLEPDDASSWESLARLLNDRGAYAEAGFCYEQLLRLTPARVELISQIAALYQHQIAVAGNTH